MAQHAKGSISVSGNKSMDLVFGELPSFSLGLTQDEVFDLDSSNIQPKEGVSSEGARLKHCNNPGNIMKKMKRKDLTKPSSPKPLKIKKSMKKKKPDEKGECSKISSPISSDFESEEEKVEEILHDHIYMTRVLRKFTRHIGCHTVNDIEHRIKSTLTKNQYNMFCNNRIFVVSMKKMSFVVQVQFVRCIMSLETKESTTNAIVIRAKGTNLHFSPREFVVVTGLNCVSNKGEFVFDEDLLNRIIEDYFGGAKYIQKRELFADFSGKIWGKDNDEYVVKFANLYFIHAFLLFAVDIVVIPRLPFDLVESGRYCDYPWGSVAFEELAKCLNKKLKPKGMFYILHGMPLAIQICSGDEDDFVSKKVFHKFHNEKKDKNNQVDNSPMGEAVETTPHHEFSPNFVHDLYKNSKYTLVTEEINGNQSTSLMEVYNEDKDDVLNNECDAEKIVDTSEDYQAEMNENKSPKDDSKKSKYDLNTSYKYSTVDCNFMNIINSVLAMYRIDDDSLNAGGKEYHLNEYINEFRMHATVPWHTIDHIFIPINVKAKHHWVLVVISFNNRCIYVYDSLSSAGHDVGVLAEVEKLAEVIPICLVACKFYEKKGIDTANHPNYKSYDNMDLFDVYVVEDLPQQPSDSWDCGIYMVTYAECLTFEDIVSPVDFDPDLIHIRYASIIWNYRMKKEEENAQSDDEAPMRPPREIGRLPARVLPPERLDQRGIYPWNGIGTLPAGVTDIMQYTGTDISKGLACGPSGLLKLCEISGWDFGALQVWDQSLRFKIPPQQDGNSTATRIRNFMKMNPPEFFRSVVGEDPQLFLKEVKKITQIMHVFEDQSVELASYWLKNIAYNWVVIWEKSRRENAAPVTWLEFQSAFLDSFFLLEMREAQARLDWEVFPKVNSGMHVYYGNSAMSIISRVFHASDMHAQCENSICQLFHLHSPDLIFFHFLSLEAQDLEYPPQFSPNQE
ncbi:hypothetical protein CQW23_16642 [Capsicum baccatum]|uniref:Ubiquitin-like protease family profile domain-containing protein n=1 Tax=Capsicum baccatum TaxID=33114 RepID=A0A2G2WBL1_CAPBA|nr:hypothetical protein CQW23_16642 [Capsicum baccatum]